MLNEAQEPFLLNPRNASVAAGFSRRPQYNFYNADYHPFVGCLVLMIAGGVGLFLIAVLIFVLYVDQEYASEGKVTQAVVIDCFHNRSNTTVTYQYSVDGTSYSEHETVNSDSCEGFATDALIDIRYLPDLPGSSQLSSFADNYGAIMLFIGVTGLALVGFAVYVLVRIIRTQQAFAKLEQHGVVLHGRIKEVKNARGYRGNPVMEIHYFFTTAQGVTLHGKSSPQFTARQSLLNLPHSGMPVAVLYADDKCYRVL